MKTNVIWGVIETKEKNYKIRLQMILLIFIHFDKLYN